MEKSYRILTYMEALFSAAIGFFVLHFASHPKSKFNKKLPSKKINRIQICPSITIEAKNRVFHFHHWMIFSSLYFVVPQFDKGILSSDLLHGLLIGGIIQGLLYADRFRVVFHRKEYKRSTYNLSFLKRIV